MLSKLLDFAVVVPTRNAGPGWTQWLDALDAQDIKPSEVLVIDSSSTDRTAELARARGYRVEIIPVSSFNHGRTRQDAVSKVGGVEVIVMLTQDAILSTKQTLNALVSLFDDPRVGAAFGRQLPRPGAKPMEAHARLFNYPLSSRVVTARDIPTLGIKAAAISNSFAAYRRSALDEVGGFPGNVPLCEDTYVAAKMLLADWEISYSAYAAVYHSHDYTGWDEFRRYFDIGVFHSRECWLLDAFGKPEGEGLRYLRSEVEYLWREAPGWVVSSIVRNVLKFTGYRLGRIERRLPKYLKKRISMHVSYWECEVDNGN